MRNQAAVAQGAEKPAHLVRVCCLLSSEEADAGTPGTCTETHHLHVSLAVAERLVAKGALAWISGPKARGAKNKPLVARFVKKQVGRVVTDTMRRVDKVLTGS